MNNGNYYLNQDINNEGIAPTEQWATTSPDLDKLNVINTRPSRINVSNPYIDGNTRASNRAINWDSYLQNGYTPEEVLGDNQTGWEKFGNALLNNVVIAGTTAVSNTAGVINGILSSLSGGSYYDNATNRAMIDAQDKMQELFPIYHSKQYNEASTLGRALTPEFWADFTQSLGFTEGMLISSFVPGALLSKAGQATNIILRSLYSSMGEASMEAIRAKQDKLNNEQTIIADSYNRLKQNAEALSQEDKQAYLSKLDSDFADTSNKITNEANKAGNMVFYANMGILTLTGIGEFGALFKRGAKSTLATAKREAKDLSKQELKSLAKRETERQAQQEAARKGLQLNYRNGLPSSIEQTLTPTEAKALEVAKGIGRSALEGTEELLQNVAVKTADTWSNYNSFNESRFNPDKRVLVDDLVGAATKSIIESVKDKDVMTEFLSGFITGGLGSPMVRSAKDSKGKFQMPIYLQGAIFEGREAMRDYNKKQRLVEEVNSKLQDSDKYREFYEHLVRDASLTERMNKAIEKNDVLTLKNTEFDKVISDVLLFKSVGFLDDYKQSLSQLADLSDAQLTQIIDEESHNSDGSVKKNSLFTTDGNPISVEEAREFITKNVKEIQSQIELVNNLDDKVSIENSELNKDNKESLIHAYAQQVNWIKRIESLEDELYEIYQEAKVDEGETIKSRAEFFRQEPSKIDELLNKVIEEQPLVNKLETLSKKSDLIKLLNSLTKLEDEIKKITSSPAKANEKSDKARQTADSKSSSFKTKGLVNQFRNAQSFDDISTIINNNSSYTEDELYAALEEAGKGDKNSIASQYLTSKKIQNDIKEGVRDKLEEAEESEETINKVIDLLSESFKEVKELSSINTGNSLFTDAIDNLEIEDIEDENKIQEIKKVIQEVIQERVEESNRRMHEVAQEDAISFLRGLDEEPNIPKEGEIWEEESLVSFDSLDDATPFISDIEEYDKIAQENQVTIAKKDSETPNESTTKVAVLPLRSAIAEFTMDSLNFISTTLGKYFRQFKKFNSKSENSDERDGAKIQQFIYEICKAKDFINLGGLYQYAKEGGLVYFGYAESINARKGDDGTGNYIPLMFVKTAAGKYKPIGVVSSNENMVGVSIIREALPENPDFIQTKNTLDTDSDTKVIIVDNLASAINPEKIYKGRLGIEELKHSVKQAVAGTKYEKEETPNLVVKGRKGIYGNTKGAFIGGEQRPGTSYLIMDSANDSGTAATVVPVSLEEALNRENSIIINKIRDYIKQLALAVQEDNKEKSREAFKNLSDFLSVGHVDMTLLPTKVLLMGTVQRNANGDLIKDKNDKTLHANTERIEIGKNSLEIIVSFITNNLIEYGCSIRVNKDYKEELIRDLIDSDLLTTYVSKFEPAAVYFELETPESIEDAKERVKEIKKSTKEIVPETPAPKTETKEKPISPKNDTDDGSFILGNLIEAGILDIQSNLSYVSHYHLSYLSNQIGKNIIVNKGGTFFITQHNGQSRDELKNIFLREAQKLGYNKEDFFFKESISLRGNPQYIVSYKEPIMDTISKDTEEINIDTITKVFNTLKESIPNLGTLNFVSEKKAREMGVINVGTTNAFVKNGNVYIVKNRTITKDILVEECLHPLVKALYYENSALFNHLYSQALSEFPTLAKQTEITYTDRRGFTEFDRMNEVVTQALSRYYSRETRENTSKTFKDYVSQFTDWFKQILEKIISRFNVNTEKYEIDIQRLDPHRTSLSTIAALLNLSDTQFITNTNNGLQQSIKPLTTVETKATDEMESITRERESLISALSQSGIPIEELKECTKNELEYIKNCKGF